MRNFIKYVLPIFFLVLLGSCNTSKDKTPDMEDLNSAVEFEGYGVYRGITPCADCPGIKTELKLIEDNLYELRTQFLDKSDSIFTEIGKFQIAFDTLITLSKDEKKYEIADGGIYQLDLQGKRIHGGLAEDYHLSKDSYPLKNVKWELAELMGAAVSANEEVKTPYILMHTSAKTISGFAGCNGIGGNYELDQETLRLSFNKLISTMMACPELETENAFKQILEKVDNYTLRDDNLMIYKGKTAALAKFKASFFE